MPRVIEAFKQFFDGAGDPLVSGWLRFTESGTNNTDKDTFADVSETIPNENPVQLDAEGRCPNVFGSGSYRVVSSSNDPLLTQPLEQIQQFDPVGGDTGLTALEYWNSQAIYSKTDLTKGSDNNYYSSLTNNNQGNDPTLLGSSWERIEFVSYYSQYRTYIENDLVRLDDGSLFVSRVDDNLNNEPRLNDTEWKSLMIRQWSNAADSFAANALCYDSTGQIWSSVIDNNLGNDPTTDDGTNWRIPFDSKVLVLSGGGDLQINRSHILTDSSTYDLPSAGDYPAGSWVVCELPGEYDGETPTIDPDGADTITDKDGSDTDAQFLKPTSVRLVTDGISDWGI